MYNAPVFYHNAARTDFFCSLVQGSPNSDHQSDEKRIIVRELDSMYTVG